MSPSESERPGASEEPVGRFEQQNRNQLKHREAAVERLLKRGLDPEAAAQAADEVISEVQEKHAAALGDDLLDHGRRDLPASHEYVTGFVERLRVHWGEGLDIYEVIVNIIDAASSACIARNRDRLREHPDLRFDVLAQLNGHALRVAREVHTLLSAGYPLGALALSRTLYELAVRASVLSEYGRLEEHQDLAERFVLHGKIANLNDVLIYQRDAEVLGYEAFEDGVVERMQTEHDALIAKYGKTYRQPYGWAVGLPGVTAGTFRELEVLAETTHRRGYYQWSSHLVHGDSKAMGLNLVERGGAAAVLTAASNRELADPADHALFGVILTFAHFVEGVDPPGPGDLFTIRALSYLHERAQNAFVDAEQAVDEAEEQLQTELGEQGQRMTPYGVTNLDGTGPTDTDRGIHSDG